MTRPEDLLSAHVAALSTAAPFAVPAARPGRRLVHLTSGGPAAEALPVADLATTFDAVLRGAGGAAALAYSDSPGLPVLRDLLAAREGVDVGRVLVTNGALHGLTLALGAVVEPGDVVVVDDPVYPDTARIVENAGGTVVGVAVDDQGLDVDVVERVVVAQRAAGRRVKAVYTVPDYQNPSGHVLSTARREQLVRLAEEQDLLVVSDNPYRLHGLDDRILPDLPDSDRVVRVSTFSKTLGPGLRLGWVVAPAWLAPHLVNVRRRVDFHSTTLTQAVVAELLGRDGWFDGLVTGARAIYRHRAATLVGSLRAHAGHVLEFTDPVGGFFVWARVVAPGVGAHALSQALGEQGFVVPDGSPFAVSAGSAAHGYLRIAYSQAAVDDLAAAGPAVAEAAAAVSAATSGVTSRAASTATPVLVRGAS